MGREEVYRTSTGEVFFSSSVASQYEIPKRLVDALFRYLNDHLKPGGFLTSVLSNDLFTAISCADPESAISLPGIVKFVHNHATYDSYGSREKVKQWVNR